MSFQNTTPRFGADKKSGAKALTLALLASAAFFGTTGTASAATCLATSQATYNACLASAVAGDVIIVTAAVSHTNPVANPGVTLQVDPGGSITDAGGNFGAGTTRLVINGTGAVTTTGVDVFASLAGNGTLITPSLQAVVFGDATNTAFSGTWNAPDLNTQLIKTGAGTLTINGMTAANGDFLQWQGVIAQSGGSTNIKSIAVGTGAGNSAIMNVTGGTLTFTGTGLVGVPCNSQCPALRIGDFGGTGVFNQSAGVVNVGAAGVAGSMNIGNQGGTGTYNMTGGTLNLGVLGDVNSAGLYSIGRSTTNTRNSVGVFNITGGTVNVNAGELINGDREVGIGVGATTSSTINLSGGTLSVKNGANLWLSAENNLNAVDSIFNLSGTGVLEIGDGRLQANYLGGGGAYQFNLGGGTIRVIDSALVTSVDANLTGASALTATQINTNGIGATWNGVLSGAGWITKAGNGTLNLGGVNTYSGGTGFLGGTVLMDATSDLGAVGSQMFFAGGTLQLGASNVLDPKTGLITVAGPGGTINFGAFSNAANASIVGSGALTLLGGGGDFFLRGNNNAHTGALNIAGGRVFADFGNAIGDTSAVTVTAATLFIRDLSWPAPVLRSETIGSLAGAGTVSIEDDMTLITGGNNTSTTFTGNINQAFNVAGSKLTKVGTGIFTVNGNTTYTGLTTVNGGTMLLNGTMSDGLLVAAAGKFGGNATITGNVTNNGRIAPGNSPGTIAMLGNYTAGVGAIFDMEVIFNGAGAPVNGTTHDFINITGNVSGSTLINVIPFFPSNAAAATTGNGIELVRVAGTTGAGNFALAGPVVVGAYEYVLNYLPNYSGALDGYFLQSRVGESMYGEAAMFAAGQAMFNACLRGDDALFGDGNDHIGRAWAKYTHGSRNTGADTGLDAEQDYDCGAGGVDLRTAGNIRLGVSGGYGESNGEVTTPSGLGKLDGQGGMMALYAAYEAGNFFANMSLGYGNMNWTFDGAAVAPLDASLSGMIGSLQLGAIFPMGSDWRFGAVAEASYDDLNCNDQCLLAGTVAEPNNWFVKGTARVDGKMGSVLPFLALSISNGDTSTVKNGTAVITTDTASSLLGAKAGASIMLGSQTALFVNGGITEGLDKDVSGWDGTGGIKIMW